MHITTDRRKRKAYSNPYLQSLERYCCILKLGKPLAARAPAGKRLVCMLVSLTAPTSVLWKDRLRWQVAGGMAPKSHCTATAAAEAEDAARASSQSFEKTPPRKVRKASHDIYTTLSPHYRNGGRR